MPHATKSMPACVALALLAACSAPTPPAESAASAESPAAQEATPSTAGDDPPATETPAPMPADGTPPAAGTPAFVGKAWEVVESEGVQAGTTYTFNPDGTLVIASGAGNPPGQGKWTYAAGKLTIEEEGMSYPTDILRLDAGHFDIRSHNPAGTLEIRMVPAA